MLLAVGDKARYRTRGSVGPVLAGALLCHEVLQRATAAPSAPDRGQLVALVDSRAATAPAEVGGALSAQGALTPYEHKVLGLFPRRGYAVLDAVAQMHARQRLIAGLTPGSRPDQATAALAVLCATSGLARAVLGPPPSKRARQEVAAHLNALRPVVGLELTEILLAVRRVYRRRDSDGASFVPEGGGEDYGDSGGDGGSGGGDGGGDGGGGD